MAGYRIAPPLQILKAACESKGLQIEFIGEESGHLARVSNGIHYFHAGGAATPTYPLNSAVAQDLCLDKSYACDLLKRAGLRVPEGRLFFPGFPSDNAFHISDRGIPHAMQYARAATGYPVIVKPNRGSMGRGVMLVDNDTDLVLAMQKTLEYGHGCLVQERISGDEFRLFCLEGKPRFLYRKTKPSVTGDGVSTLKELVFRQTGFDFEKTDPLQTGILLRQQKASLVEAGAESSLWNAVVKDGAMVELSALGNLAAGAKVMDFTTEFSNVHKEMAGIIADALQVRIYGIDFFANGDVSSPDECTIIEVNGNPSLRGTWDSGRKDLCIAIWSDIFDAYFTERGSNIT